MASKRSSSLPIACSAVVRPELLREAPFSWEGLLPSSLLALGGVPEYVCAVVDQTLLIKFSAMGRLPPPDDARLRRLDAAAAEFADSLRKSWMQARGTDADAKKKPQTWCVMDAVLCCVRSLRLTRRVRTQVHGFVAAVRGYERVCRAAGARPSP